MKGEIALKEAEMMIIIIDDDEKKWNKEEQHHHRWNIAFRKNSINILLIFFSYKKILSVTYVRL